MRGYIETRGETTFRIKIYLSTQRGKQSYYRETFHGKKKDAENRLIDLLAEFNKGNVVRPESITFGEFLDQWLENYARQQTSFDTREGYRTIIEAHLKPALGKIPLQKLLPMHIQTYHTNALERGRKDGRGQRLSPSTLKKHHAVISKALKCAVRWGLVMYNVADRVERPRSSKPNIVVWNESELLQFIAVAKPHELYPLFVTVAYTGLRLSEFLGLKWECVDLDKRVLWVTETCKRGGRNPRFGPPKTHRSRRNVPFSEEMAVLLRTHKVAQNKVKLALGERYRDYDLVFATIMGTPYWASNIRRVWNALITKAGVRRITIHALRHTHATLMLSAGIHPKVVSERLGHATVSFTLDTYSHVLPSIQEAAVVSFDEHLEAAKKKAKRL